MSVSDEAHPGPPSPDLRALRRENLARLLIRAFDAFERDVLRGFRERGIELQKSWLPVLRNVEAEGSRITEIAEAAGLAKQTVGPIVHELAGEGILRVDPDPEDGRAKRVRFTPAGMEGLREGLGVLRETEARYAAALGEERMAALREALIDLLRHFEGGGP